MADNFFKKVAETIEHDGFRPAEISSGKGVTLHAAIRKTIHTKFDEDLAAVGFWEWKELDRFLRAVWEVLDAAATDAIGSSTSAIAWSYPKERTQGDVLGVLGSAAGKLPKVPDCHLRPTSDGVPIRDQVLKAIVETIAVIAIFEGGDYATILSEVASVALSNTGLLEELDRRVSAMGSFPDVGDRQTLIPRELARAYEVQVEKSVSTDDEVPNFANFILKLDSESSLVGKSNSEILRSLISIAPEKPKESYHAKVQVLLGG